MSHSTESKRVLAAAMGLLAVPGAFAGDSAAPAPPAPAATAAAAKEPTVSQVYAAAKSGHLDQAHEMIERVLKAHPESGKAHYVAAEISARQQNYGLAREELKQAEKLEPGLPFASPKGVQKLKQELAREAHGKPVR